ncbi:Sel1 domain protein repeat-containing protein [Seminavis robusta]|uniref:Sel1 domain protein repeat-containing protein n=1 Tax=Seminavis robusta TaxID=568900 RepID=A0A9N8F1Q9_9STRA|nr:Sel1 domain protein repeat-containing protein [Seminavis robusta]|eukprot:Sro2646_g333580.1 Sel1 domain protein repeat-containing protein (295) ;mRNA; r:6622-7506
MSTAATNVDTMSCRQLQQECNMRSLRASDKAEVLRKRLRQSMQATRPPAKRPKKSAADDLICPISLELPWDPVTAEDGRVYEREYIEEHIKKNPGNLTSPITREKMGTQLFPAIQHHNTIETLVEFGVIDGDLAAKWKEKVEMEELLKKAAAGNGEAMHSVAVNYSYGDHGFVQHDKLAFHWYKRAHEAGNVKAKATVGQHYLLGSGVARQQLLGLFYLTDAASQGSNFAAYELGMTFANGLYGLSVDKTEAIRWLEKSLGNCPHKHLCEDSKSEAQQKLDELKSSVPAGSATS